MPDNQMKGILETFLRSLIPKPSPLFDYVKASVAAIPDSERRFKQSKGTESDHPHVARLARRTRTAAGMGHHCPFSQRKRSGG